MNQIVKQHLPVIIVTTVLGLITGGILMKYVHDSASSMDVAMFEGLIFVIPCAIMLVVSFIIAFTAEEIGRSLYVAVLGICLACGVVSMLVGSSWLSSETVTAQLLANSPDDTVIVPILRSPMTILRDIAAYIVVPTVGCILGAWVGSRVHPLRGEKNPKGKKGKK